jgi:hypothetical protein
VDHPALDATAVAPGEQSRSTTSVATFKPATWLEGYVAQQVAGAAAALLMAYQERLEIGDLTSGTRRTGAELVAEVVKLRNFLISRVDDFETMARRGGAAVLRQNCNELSVSTCEALVGAVLEVVASVVRQELN